MIVVNRTLNDITKYIIKYQLSSLFVITFGKSSTYIIRSASPYTKSIFIDLLEKFVAKLKQNFKYQFIQRILRVIFYRVACALPENVLLPISFFKQLMGRGT